MTALLFAGGYLVVFLTALVPIQEPDFWWHLASGRYILAHHAAPTVDPFSWTARGTPWVDSYWAYDALMDIGFKHFGVTGLVVSHALLVLGIFFVFNRRMLLHRVSWGWRLAALLLLLQGGGPAGGYWGAEASLVSLLFFSILVWHWEFLQKHPGHASLWAWPFLFALWANLHRGFMIGLVIAAFFLLEESCRSGRWLRNSLWFLACALASLATPYGGALYRMIWDDFALSSQWILGWGPADYIHLRLFYVALVCFGGLLIYQVKSKDRRAIMPMLVGTLLAAESVRHLVYIPYFMVFALPWIAAQLSAVRFPWTLETRRWLERLIIVGFAIVLTEFAYARFPRSARFDGGTREVFPFIRKTAIAGPFYNDYVSGGYWIWAFDGNPPVFMDGRYPAVQGYKPVVIDLLQGEKSAADWRLFLRRYSIEAALVKYRDPGVLDSMFHAMFPRDRWALVYWDDQDVLYLRRGKNDPIIKKYEFSQVWPDITRPAFIQQIQRLTRSERGILERELLRNGALHPSSRRVRAMISVLRRPPSSAGGDTLGS